MTFHDRLRGFSLVELAIVLMVVSLLIGGMLVPFSAQQELSRRKETEQMLKEAKEALIGFALINQRLPCAAPVGTADGAAGTPCNPPVMPNNPRFGIFPWQTVGVAHQRDQWAHRFTYSVTPAMTVNPIDCFAGAGDITVRTRDAAGALVNLTGLNEAVAVILSHGKEAAWAYTDAGVRVADSANINTDEDTNSGAAGTSFVSRPIAAPGSPVPGEFDDALVWVTRNELVARMAAAGRC